MIEIVGLGSRDQIFTFCDHPVSRLRRSRPASETVGLGIAGDDSKDQRIFLDYLKRTNKVCSLSLFAAFVPVQPSRLSNVFCPISSSVTGRGSFGKVIRLIGAISADILTLPFRLITFLPRVITTIGCSGFSSFHPVNWVIYSQGPWLISQGGERFYYSKDAILENDAKNDFLAQFNKVNEPNENLSVYQYHEIESDNEDINLASNPDGFARIIQRIRVVFTGLLSCAS